MQPKMRSYPQKRQQTKSCAVLYYRLCITTSTHKAAHRRRTSSVRMLHNELETIEMDDSAACARA
jgi:hypothetical protein